MFEKWLQWTCDGCGETDMEPHPDTTIKESREWMKEGGWVCNRNGDFCPKCVKQGRHKQPSFLSS